MSTVWIDSKRYADVDPGRNMLDIALTLGFDLPYFCWHPAMGSVGACRQCAVKQLKDEKDARGRIVMACMTPAIDRTRISIADPEAVAFRKSVAEWLMVNHPHDCPVCDEGGECHLQDMTHMTGQVHRRYRFKKRTFRNQDLGPLVRHEMNRCIECYRCVRYYRDHAGGRDFNVFAAHDHVYFGRAQDGTLESPYAGNLVEVCPTGVFTDKTLSHHYTRKWDLTTAPSVCVHCSLGCNTIPGERYGELRRVRNRYNEAVNGYFLCDRGRYGYAFVNGEERLRVALESQSQNPGPSGARRAASRGRQAQASPPRATSSNPQAGWPGTTAAAADRPPRDGRGFGIGSEPSGREHLATALSRDEAVARLAALVRNPERVIGLGSPRASLESNFVLRRLVGPSRFFAGLTSAEARLINLVWRILRDGHARSASLREVERADAVLVLGEDATNTAPILGYALRQAARVQPAERLAVPRQVPLWQDAAARDAIGEAHGPLYVATPASVELDGFAKDAYHGAPRDIARLGFAVAHALDPEAPEAKGLTPAEVALAVRIAADLRNATRPVVVSGTGTARPEVIEAAANVGWALGKAREEGAALFLTVPECNSLGLAMLLAASGDDVVRASLEAAATRLRDGQADTVIVLENDLYRRAPAELVEAVLGRAAHVVVIDSIATETAARAELVLPAASFAEGDGTLVNNEGRAQRSFRVFAPRDDITESWRWLARAGAALGRRDLEFATLDDLLAALAADVPELGGARDAAPRASFRVGGAKVARESHRYSGRTSMTAHLSVHEPKPPDDPDSPLSFTMEGAEAPEAPGLLARLWWPGWNSPQALTRFQQEIGGPLRGGHPGVRLLEPSLKPPGQDRPAYFAPGARASGGESGAVTSAAPAPHDGELELVPLHHVFGSEELSALSPPIAALAPPAYVALSPKDAAARGIRAGDDCVVELESGDALRLPARVLEMLATGLAGLPQGLGLLGSRPVPDKGKVRRA